MGTRALFHALADALQGLLLDGEQFLAAYAGEDSDFVRFNHGLIRQAGHVRQRTLSVDLIHGRRHSSAAIALGGGVEEDLTRLAELIGELRAQRALLQDDPHLLICTDPASSVREEPDLLPPATTLVAEIQAAAQGLDLVGILACGAIEAGCATSFGQRSWHSVSTFNLDWSCYAAPDRAVKHSYAGTRWETAELERLMAQARSDLAALARPPKVLLPGRYRAYFAPAAVEGLVGMLNQGGFSCKSHRTRTTPLLRMASGEQAMHREVNLVQDRLNGLTPAFTSDGFRKAESTTMVRHGRLHDLLISPRSAKEFGLTPNAGDEYADSLMMPAGSLDRDEILARLLTGLVINNVWYCNFSDVNACRITGMTRFACFWVEDGVITAPLPVMRFDDTLYGILGDRLLGITRQRELMLSSSTYGGRSLASSLLPGILVDGMALTL